MAKYKKSYLKLLQETVDYYSKDTSRRGLNEGSNEDSNGSKCVYLSPISGNMCAVGRCMTEESVKKLGGANVTANGIVSELNINELDDVIQPKYRGYHIQFWLEMQHLHDSNYNWDSKGLTESGERCVESIKRKINNNMFA